MAIGRTTEFLSCSFSEYLVLGIRETFVSQKYREFFWIQFRECRNTIFREKKMDNRSFRDYFSQI